MVIHGECYEVHGTVIHIELRPDYRYQVSETFRIFFCDFVEKIIRDITETSTPLSASPEYISMKLGCRKVVIVKRDFDE